MKEKLSSGRAASGCYTSSDVTRSDSTAEVERLRWMIQYALDAPDDARTIKSILFDALNGCSGAGNVDEIRKRFGSYDSLHSTEV